MFSFKERSEEIIRAEKALEAQEKEYTFLMKEKEEVEEEIMQNNIYNFVMSRSARTIQRTWRIYNERKKAKKRARLGEPVS